MAKIGINIATGSLQQNEIIVGIDLGTTNSLVAIMHPETKQPIALKEFNSSSLVPSVVHFTADNQIIVGDEAKTYLETDPEHTIFSAKRLMGKSYNDIRQSGHQFSYNIIDDDTEALVKVAVNNHYYSPIELSSLILAELKKRAEHILKTPVNKAVITVPAYFNDTQRQATRDAGKLAGLDVLRIINEPTAASLAYGFGLDKTKSETIAVYDLGGGTFDISILQITDGIFEVLSTNGDTYLGGDDFDQAIIKHWTNQYQLHLHTKEDVQVLRLLAEEAKKTLSKQNQYEATFQSQQLILSKTDFEACIAPLIQKTLTCCAQALKDAQFQPKALSSVILVGGSTRVPAVKQAVQQFFNVPINDTINPDESVALGAAIQADILAGNNKDMLLLDITPLSLGIETMGGLMDVLIPRNAKIPSKAGRQYTTQKDGQVNMRISVYQGERDLVAHNRKLAEFNLTGIPAMPAGLPKVEVSFLIDADGILKVNAKELRSGVEQAITVTPQYGLTDEQVEAMLKESIDHAKDDMQTRALIEAQTEAEQVLATTEKFIQKNNAIITQPELMATATAMQNLQMAIDLKDKNQIQQKLEELNEITRPFAERAMDTAIAQAMKGKKI